MHAQVRSELSEAAAETAGGALGGQRGPGGGVRLAVLDEPDVAQALKAVVEQIDQACWRM